MPKLLKKTRVWIGAVAAVAIVRPEPYQATLRPEGIDLPVEREGRFLSADRRAAILAGQVSSGTVSLTMADVRQEYSEGTRRESLT
jgi:hypothetical protein